MIQLGTNRCGILIAIVSNITETENTMRIELKRCTVVQLVDGRFKAECPHKFLSFVTHNLVAALAFCKVVGI